MNQVPEERKEALTKSFAIVGFVAIILFAVWLAVQIVSLMPTAFSSLASLADGVYNYRPATEMQVATRDSVVNAGEAFTISWTTHSEEGIYYFSYACTDGVALSLRGTGDIVNVACDTDVELVGSGSTEIIVESEKQRFIDVPYTISFTGVNGTELFADSEVTIVNASIPTTVANEEPEEEVEETPEPEVAGETTTTGNTGGTGLVAGTPTTIEEIIYAIPASDPNGTVDLAVKFLGVGIMTKDKTFVRTGIIDKDQTGAFQFEVKNLGTKTSDKWTFEAEMPSDIDYTSKNQNPLKPNERAVITLGFEGITKTGVERFGASIDTDEDTDSRNNSFISAVNITD